MSNSISEKHFYIFIITFIHFCLIFGVVSKSDLERGLRVITH